MVRAGGGGAVSQPDNVVPILLVFKVKTSSNPAEIQRLMEGLILLTAGACTFWGAGEGAEGHPA